ncbi:MAG: hypothetical protein VW771_09655, partial [Gammaproteobacteria bacterium]
MRIVVYAGALRPGGGLAVLRQVLRALVENSNREVVVIISNDDTEMGVSDLISSHPNLSLRRYMMNRNSSLRYLLSKFLFLFCKENDWLLTFNYYLPAPCTTFCYHINLLSFLVGNSDTLPQKIRRFDSRLACRFT